MLIYFTIAFVQPFISFGQVNYVKNPGLEIYDSCPNDFDQIRYANFWNCLDSAGLYFANYPGVPEYCNKCSQDISCSVPYNGYFYHFTHSGNGMAQVQVYYDSSQVPAPFNLYRDYLQGRFTRNLTVGHNYCITFFIAWEQISSYSFNNVGAFLDNGIIDTTSKPSYQQSQVHPQVNETFLLGDSTHWNDSTLWYRIEGTFTANGLEKFISIGNFFDKAHTNSIWFDPWNRGSGYGWVLVDDVSVIESNTIANAGNDTNIHKGDSILIGEIAVPYTWYKRTDTGLSLIDSVSGGIWVKPDSSTTYVVKLTLCGLLTWDSIKVTVVPVGNTNLNNPKLFSIFPNPNNGTFYINGNSEASNAEIEIIDMIGQSVYKRGSKIIDGLIDEEINLKLAPGIFTLKLTTDLSERYIQQIQIRNN